MNPNQRVLFKRVNIREFAFNFTFVPVNAGDGNSNEHGEVLQKYLYPEAIEAGGIKVGYKFPEKFKLKWGVH